MKARELLEAQYADDTTECSVSLEGIGDLISKVKNTFNKPKGKPGELFKKETHTPDGKRALAELRQAITRLYMSDSWLKRQTLVTADINAGDITKVFEMDGKVNTDIAKAYHLHEKRVTSFVTTYTSQLTRFSSNINVIVKQTRDHMLQFKKGGATDNMLQDVLDDAVGHFKKLPDPLNNLPRFDGTAMGNLVPSIKVNKNDYNPRELQVVTKTTPKGTETLPALTNEGIKELAKIMLSIIDDPSVDNIPWIRGEDHSDGSEFNEITEFLNDDDYYRHFYHQGLNQIYCDALYEFVEQKWKVVGAIEKYIHRSIK